MAETASPDESDELRGIAIRKRERDAMKKTLSALLLAALLLTLFTITALAASYYTFTGDCNVRTGPSLSYSILGVAAQGTRLNALGGTSVDERGVAWYSVSYGGRTGWVSSLYDVADGNTGSYTASSGVVTFSGNCNVRSSPSLSGAVLGSVSAGSSLPVLGDTSVDDRGVAWYSVSYKGGVGWVSSVYASYGGSWGYDSWNGDSWGDDSYTPTFTGWGYYTFSASTHVRTGPGTDYKSLGSVRKGSTLPSLGGVKYDARGVAWYSVDFDDQTGWVSSAYATATSTPGDATYGGGGSRSNDTFAGSQYATSGSYVEINGKCNVRTGPSLNDKSLGTIKKGEIATYAGLSSTDSRGVTWYKIYFNNTTGWVSSTYATLY